MLKHLTAPFAVTSPGITALVLLTAAIGAWFAPGTIDPIAMIILFVGIALSSMSANALNAVVDRDRDAVMTRTMHRPIPAGLMSARTVLIEAVVLGCAGLALSFVGGGGVAGLLVTLTLFGYVFVYSIWLKPRSGLATEIGGFFGALPPVIGWAAVAGSIDLGAVLLYALVWFWQPPHFWALAEKYRDDYAAVNLPVLPVVRPGAVIPRSWAYMALTTLVSVWLYFAGLGGRVYLGGAVALGMAFLGMIAYEGKSGRRMPRVRFVMSLVYLTGVFGLLALERFGVIPG